MILTIAYEKGQFGTVMVPRNAKVLTCRMKGFLIGNELLKGLEGIDYRGEELENDMSNFSTTGNYTEIKIYNLRTGKLICETE